MDVMGGHLTLKLRLSKVQISTNLRMIGMMEIQMMDGASITLYLSYRLSDGRVMGG